MTVCVCRATRTTMAESRCPELLAQYCDVLLRKGTSTHKKYSSEEIETKIKDVVSIFGNRYSSITYSRLPSVTAVEVCAEQGCIYAVLQRISNPASYLGHIDRQ